jgi:hypothetical protein
MKNYIRNYIRISCLALIAFTFSFLVACSSIQKDIQLQDAFWKKSNQKISIITTIPARSKLHTEGSQGLLDYAIASIATRGMNNYLRSLDLSWYRNVPLKFASQLKQHNFNAHAYMQQINPSSQNYADVGRQMGSDTLLVIQLEAIGTKRDYYGFIPAGAPQAYCVLTGELISVKTKQVVWRHRAAIAEPVQGSWDQPPHYPNLSFALKHAIETAEQELLDSFFSGH